MSVMLKERIRDIRHRIAEIVPLTPMADYEIDTVLTAFADELIKAERERCAQVADGYILPLGPIENDTDTAFKQGGIEMALQIREDIRALD